MYSQEAGTWAVFFCNKKMGDHYIHLGCSQPCLTVAWSEEDWKRPRKNMSRFLHPIVDRGYVINVNTWQPATWSGYDYFTGEIGK